LVVVVRSAAASGVGIGLDGVAPLIGVSPSFLETFFPEDFVIPTSWLPTG